MIEVDTGLIERFENQLDPSIPDAGDIPLTVLGYGEISAVFQIRDEEGVVFKRLPPFPDRGQVRQYRQAVEEYGRVLTDLGIRLADTSAIEIRNARGEYILYLAQERFPSGCVGNSLMQSLPAAEGALLLEKVLNALAKVWRKNREDAPHEEVGIDGQISNWAFLDEPVYFDTGTPLLRREGRESLNAEIFLQSMPRLIRGVVRRHFLPEIVDRYYRLRSVLVDLAANFFKEGRQDLVVLAIDAANRFVESEAPGISPLNFSEVRSYYRRDAFMWNCLWHLRRVDRFFKIRIMRTRYNFILPGKIRR